jgi:3-hydroxybutyryl-CoA dehydrogenase
MKLVEIVKGNQTADEVIEALILLCKQFDKVAVICKDSPGFIVNRIARQYYFYESMALVEKGSLLSSSKWIISVETNWF